jgi:membrane dipeptidase
MTSSISQGDALAHAHRLLEKLPLIDGHNGLGYNILHAREAGGDVGRYDLMREPDGNRTNIPLLRAGQLSAQCWSAYIPPDEPRPAGKALELIAVINQFHEMYPEVFVQTLTAADIGKAKRAGKIASLLCIEGGTGLENSIAPLRIWYAAGARMVTLGHGVTVDWIDSVQDDEASSRGITAFGSAVVAELNRLGMIIDLSHAAPRGMHQILDIAKAPVVMSHGNARAVSDHPRNMADDVLDRFPVNGGMVMVSFVPEFVNHPIGEWMKPLVDGFRKEHRRPVEPSDMKTLYEREKSNGSVPRATLEQVCDHVDYLVKRIGIDHVGIGSAFFGGPTPDGLEDVSRFPHLLAELIRRGYEDSAIAKIASGNFVRVFQTVENVSRNLRGLPR